MAYPADTADQDRDYGALGASKQQIWEIFQKNQEFPLPNRPARIITSGRRRRACIRAIGL